jgi:hypothetical protein
MTSLLSWWMLLREEKFVRGYKLILVLIIEMIILISS